MSYFSESAKKSSIQPNLISPSPFRYNPKGLNKPVCAQVPFGSTAKLDRSITISNKQKNNQLSIQPYNQYQNAISQLADLDKQQKHSSAFISKTQRFQKLKQQLPGPGEYNILTERKLSKSIYKLSKLKKKTNHSLSTSQIKAPSIPSDHLGYRQDENNIMKKVIIAKSIDPHPGSYDIQTDLTNSRGLKWKTQSNKPKTNSLLTPGPGAYDYKTKTQLKAPVSSFVSQTKRFDDKNLLKPGPGSYNVFPMNKKSHSLNQDGNFNSKTSRFSFINTNQNIGPGKYFNSIKQRVKAKSVSTLRPKINQKQNTQIIVQKKTIFDEKNLNPGPGQYANTQGITFKLQKQLFRKFNDTTLPKQKRVLFEISQTAITPGPGSYSAKKEEDDKKQKKVNPYKKQPKRTQVVNLKDPADQITPSPFDYGNYNNTIQDKIVHYENRMTLTQSKPFGSGDARFKHYEGSNRKNEVLYTNQQEQQISQTAQSNKDLGYYQNNKKVKKLVMTNLKVKVPFGSSTSKMPQTIISQSPGKFYEKQKQWVKKSHNIRSKLN